MGQQFMELLLDVSKQLSGVERTLTAIQNRQQEIGNGLSELTQRVTALEATDRERERWSGEERRKVDQRLGSGDHTFEALKEKIKQAEQTARDAAKVANWSREQLQKKTTSTQQKLVWKLLDKAAPYIVGFVWWLLYHLLMNGPKIAESMKKVGGGHP